MEQLMTLTNEKFGEIQTIEKDGKIYFNGKAIASALGYKDTVNALKQHCRVKGVVKHHYLTRGGKQEGNFIDEGNVYRLIAKSKLPSAELFEQWIFDEVLPSIRKTGKYEMKQVVSEEAKGKAIRILKLNGMEVISDPDIMRYTGATRWVVRYYSQKVGERGILIDGQELVRLKRDNPTLSKYTNQLLVHCLSGAEKILRAMGVPMRLVPVKIPTEAVNEIPLIPKETVNNWFPKSLRDPVVRDDTRKAFEYAIRKISDKDVPKELREAYITVANDIYMRTHPYLEHC